MSNVHHYGDRARLAEALATGVAAVLAGAIAMRGEARLAVSGGSTPVGFFRRLSQVDIEWSKVTVTLVDERFVDPTSERSNLRLVRENLLQEKASAAHMVPLTDGSLARIEEAVATADHAIAMLGRLDAAILGMGNDGHTASFFPSGDRLREALDPRCPHHVLSMIAPGAGEPRLTMTLHALLDAHFLALHIEGEEKSMTLEKARQAGPVEEMPVRAVLRGAGDKLQIFQAP
ncbi:MAG: 6-phosphogluconolactonase [Nitratireductor sp.]|nr:6-phosphogluconolactonase [Nitratireductor sp.]